MDKLEKKVLQNPDKVKELIKKVSGVVSVNIFQDKKENESTFERNLNKGFDKGWGNYGKP